MSDHLPVAPNFHLAVNRRGTFTWPPTVAKLSLDHRMTANHNQLPPATAEVQPDHCRPTTMKTRNFIASTEEEDDESDGPQKDPPPGGGETPCPVHIRKPTITGTPSPVRPANVLSYEQNSHDHHFLMPRLHSSHPPNRSPAVAFRIRKQAAPFQNLLVLTTSIQRGHLALLILSNHYGKTRGGPQRGEGGPSKKRIEGIKEETPPRPPSDFLPVPYRHWSSARPPTDVRLLPDAGPPFVAKLLPDVELQLVARFISNVRFLLDVGLLPVVGLSPDFYPTSNFSPSTDFYPTSYLYLSPDFYHTSDFLSSSDFYPTPDFYYTELQLTVELSSNFYQTSDFCPSIDFYPTPDLHASPDYRRIPIRHRTSARH
ncbi:hypothetical protein MA16_Dca004301 [Dendrobium catenatum]|uniref:Uncharacterized protein n=1 Tax=Dendrobium catenatum TaxID=906689 RepID=A0A2I0W722_9ASPA|nr:hypothetical protein MA16_Dca004301 [Dendrobium catenatum]